jgi:nitrite reductase/ring-hydroxylating ferredoxin subunit
MPPITDSIAHSTWQSLPALTTLQDGGEGVRFELKQGETTLPAFAVKYDGKVYAYLNQCAHIAMEMDWQAGQFFDLDQRFIMCSTHAALYEPSTGLCIAGPCLGKQLKPVALRLDNGTYYAPHRI